MGALDGMNATETASGLYECWELKSAKRVSQMERTFGPSTGGHGNSRNLTQRTCCITCWKSSPASRNIRMQLFPQFYTVLNGFS